MSFPDAPPNGVDPVVALTQTYRNKNRNWLSDVYDKAKAIVTSKTPNTDNPGTQPEIESETIQTAKQIIRHHGELLSRLGLDDQKEMK